MNGKAYRFFWKGMTRKIMLIAVAVIPTLSMAEDYYVIDRYLGPNMYKDKSGYERVLKYMYEYNSSRVMGSIKREGYDIHDKITPVVVTEYFNYYCSHCYSLEGALLEWKEKMGGRVIFVRRPVYTRPDKKWPFDAYYSVLSALNDVVEVDGDNVFWFGAKHIEKDPKRYSIALDKSHMAIFKKIHEEKLIPNTADEYISLYKGLGVNFDEVKFRKAYEEFSALSVGYYKQWPFYNAVRRQESISVGGISWPTLVVEDTVFDREYVIKAATPQSMLATATKLVEVIENRSPEEVDKERKARYVEMYNLMPLSERAEMEAYQHLSCIEAAKNSMSPEERREAEKRPELFAKWLESRCP